MIQFDIITIFPKIFDSFLAESIIKRAQEKGLVKIKIHNLRDWAKDKHKTVDDRPYGGGIGMVMKIEPIYKAVKEIKEKSKFKKSFCLLLGEKNLIKKLPIRFQN
jgi:tRNA (guanine37-N1)-methyltransferase